MNALDRKKVIQKYYAKRAKEYDRQKSRTWKSAGGFGNEVFEEMLQGLKDCEGKLILEVGVGSARNAKPLLEKIGLNLVGVDLSKEMLRIAGNKLASYGGRFSPILGDGENLPFIEETFAAILCMSTMHYFSSQEKTLSDFRRLLKTNGILIYGDLSPHESDDDEFFENLERTISKAHARYYKASEMKRLMKENGFHTTRTKIIGYEKSYDALIEDKGKYFDVGIKTLHELTQAATAKTKKQYALTKTGLTQFYTVITATKEKCD